MHIEQPTEEGSGDVTHAGRGASAGTRITGRSLLNKPTSQKERTPHNAQLKNISVPGRGEQEGGEAQASCKELQKGEGPPVCFTSKANRRSASLEQPWT